ncbi:MAG: hypothetical protein Q4D32_00300 [Eubacteriales bacterium]|nr:hypothetical protein [Eubacteriales bacterium]
MKRIKKWSIGMGLLTLAVMLSIVGAPKKGQAMNVKEVTVVNKSKTKIQVKWKLKKKIRNKVSQIRIYRTTKVNKDLTDRKNLTKIATLSGKKKSYIDKVKFNKNYAYEVVAYQKKGKKYKEIGSERCYAYSGVAKTVWEEYSFCDAMTTPKMIPIKVSMGGLGFRPDGFQIYRSTDGKNFKKIKTIQKKSWLLSYKDQTVQSHGTYYYKVRAFRTIGKKKYYGVFSLVEKHSAVNYIGKYSVKLISEEGNAVPSLTVCLTSDAGNGDLVLEKECWGQLCVDDSKSVTLNLSQYSYDGKTWYSLTDKQAVVKPGQSIYLKFEYENGTPFAFNIGKTVTQIEDCNAGYANNDLAYLLTIDFMKMEASVCVNKEMYH